LKESFLEVNFAFGKRFPELAFEFRKMFSKFILENEIWKYFCTANIYFGISISEGILDFQR